jgi:predicted PurR-regulated permease PerM
LPESGHDGNGVAGGNGTVAPFPTIDDLTFNPDLPTPIYISSRVRFFLLAAVGLVLVWLAMNAPSVPRLLVLGSTLSLVLSFPVRLLTRWLPRGIAIIVVVLSAIGLVIISLALLIPFTVSEISRFAASLPDTVDSLENVLRDILQRFYERGWIDQTPDRIINNLQDTMFSQSQAIAENLLANLTDTLSSTFNLLITAFGTLFIATYLLIDIPRFRESFIRSFAPSYRPDAERLWQTLGESLSRYLAGLSISIVAQGVMAGVGLFVLDVPYAAILGIWMSATAILPYVGAFLGAIPAVLIALTISWNMAIVTVILYIVVNQIDSNFITPRVQGNAVRVHPLLIFLAVIAGGEIAGGLGTVMAVPTLAVLRVLGEFFWVRLRVRGVQEDTLLAAMRNDLTIERLGNQTATPDATHRFMKRPSLKHHPAGRMRKVVAQQRVRQAATRYHPRKQSAAPSNRQGEPTSAEANV